MQKTTPKREIDERLSVAVHVHPISTFEGVKKVKSIWRAIRRGKASRNGMLYPYRPFNNAKRTRGRKLQKEFEKTKVSIDQYLERARLIDEKNAAKEH